MDTDIGTLEAVDGKTAMLRSMNRTIDLNDLFYFAEVVTHGGFAAAGRALRLPKSKLSRRVAQLEQRLGARLIERSSRRFRVTDLGRQYFKHCREGLEAMQRAESAITDARNEPRGILSFSVPTGLVELLSPIVGSFLQRYPRVDLRMLAIDHTVDLIAEKIDVALRVRAALDSDATLTLRTLAHSRRTLFASPAVANLIHSPDISMLAKLPTLSTNETDGPVTWELEGPDGATEHVAHQPRLACGSFRAVKDAAIAGLGVALLPDHSCFEDLRSGALVRVFPGWHGQTGIVHLVFTTRRGLPLHVRTWIDHLAAAFRDHPAFPPSA
jgi:DNA-binding transcriptional LysR family regulator